MEHFEHFYFNFSSSLLKIRLNLSQSKLLFSYFLLFEGDNVHHKS